MLGGCVQHEVALGERGRMLPQECLFGAGGSEWHQREWESIDVLKMSVVNPVAIPD